MGKRGTTGVSNIVVLSGSVRKSGNTELLVQAFIDGAKKNNSVEVISVADYKVNPCIGCNTCFDRLHIPMRNEFKLKKLALILVGAATLPELFDAIKVQYRLVLNYFKLEDVGTVFVRGAKDKGDVKNTDGLEKAYQLGTAI